MDWLTDLSSLLFFKNEHNYFLLLFYKTPGDHGWCGNEDDSVPVCTHKPVNLKELLIWTGKNGWKRIKTVVHGLKIIHWQ